MTAKIDTISEIRSVLRDALDIGDRADGFDRSTQLFGALPEFDSMAVLHVVLELEGRFKIEIDGDEIDAEVFDTMGSLAEFVDGKLAVS